MAGWELKFSQGGYSAQIGVHAVRFRLMFVDFFLFILFFLVYAYYAYTCLDEEEDEDEAECRDPIPYVRDEKNKSRIIDM